MIERCGDCYWWNKAEKECWRYPPVPHFLTQANLLTGRADPVVIGLHAPTPDTHWCGEFRAKQGGDA